MARRCFFASATWLDAEEMAYPNGGYTRNGLAILKQNPHNPIDLNYGAAVKVKASIPDTFFTIPAKIRAHGFTIRGFLSMSDLPGVEEKVLTFTPEASPRECVTCAPGTGCKR